MIGPFKRTVRGHEFVLTVTDYYVEAVARGMHLQSVLPTRCSNSFDVLALHSALRKVK